MALLSLSWTFFKELIALLSEPFILGLLGSYVFERHSKRREQREKTREKAVEFVTRVADDVNALFARIFAHLRGGPPGSPKLAELLGKRQQALFEKRLSVQVKSRAYLGCDDLFNDYERVIWASRYVVDLIHKVEQGQLPERGEATQAVKAEIRERSQLLEESWPLTEQQAGGWEQSPPWPLPDEQAISAGLPPPYDELFLFAKKVEHRAIEALSHALGTALSGSRPVALRTRRGR